MHATIPFQRSRRIILHGQIFWEGKEAGEILDRRLLTPPPSQRLSRLHARKASWPIIPMPTKIGLVCTQVEGVAVLQYGKREKGGEAKALGRLRSILCFPKPSTRPFQERTPSPFFPSLNFEGGERRGREKNRNFLSPSLPPSLVTVNSRNN